MPKLQKNFQAKPVQPESYSMLLLPSPALLLAEGIAEAEAKKARLRAQQVRVAKGKKGRFGAALRYLWGKTKHSQVDSQRIDVCIHAVRPYRSCQICGRPPFRESEFDRESGQPLRTVPPKEAQG